jgi:hypothetical protein
MQIIICSRKSNKNIKAKMRGPRNSLLFAATCTRTHAPLLPRTNQLVGWAPLAISAVAIAGNLSCNVEGEYLRSGFGLFVVGVDSDSLLIFAFSILFCLLFYFILYMYFWLFPIIILPLGLEDLGGEGTFVLDNLSELLHAVHWPQIGCIFRCLFLFWWRST